MGSFCRTYNYIHIYIQYQYIHPTSDQMPSILVLVCKKKSSSYGVWEIEIILWLFVVTEKLYSKTMNMTYTVCPRCRDPFYIVTYSITNIQVSMILNKGRLTEQSWIYPDKNIHGLILRSACKLMNRIIFPISLYCDILPVLTEKPSNKKEPHEYC